jgi:hypothetical protein
MLLRRCPPASRARAALWFSRLISRQVAIPILTSGATDSSIPKPHRARDAKAVLTAEERQVTGGFGSAVAEALSAAGVAKPLRILGIPDQFVEHATPKVQLGWFGLNTEGIARAATELCVPEEDHRLTALLGG